MVLRDILLAEAAKWDDDRIARRVNEVCAEGGDDGETMNAWCMEHLGTRLTPDQIEEFADDPTGTMDDVIRTMMRAEMIHFERWILLQIIDGAWKDHLHGMDQLRESIGYRSFSQRDPRIEFKREGANLYEEMQMEIRDRVTDLIFKAKLQPQVQQRPAADAPKAKPTPPQPAGGSTAAAAAAAGAGSPQQQRDIEAAQQAGAKRPAQAARTNRPAASGVTLGRNEIVTVLDPRSGKKETMKYKKAMPLLKQGWRLVNE